MEIKAVFYAYQPTLREPYPMYNIEGGEYDKDTVSKMRLEELGIKVPYTPGFAEWSRWKVVTNDLSKDEEIAKKVVSLEQSFLTLTNANALLKEKIIYANMRIDGLRETLKKRDKEAESRESRIQELKAELYDLMI